MPRRDIGSESPAHLLWNLRDVIGYGEYTVDDSYQAGTEQMWQVPGQPHLFPLPGGIHQAKQLCHCAGPQCGHPEPSNIWVGGAETAVSADETHRDSWSDSGCGTEPSTRVSRGTTDRRTILATRRCIGSHTRDTYKYR